MRIKLLLTIVLCAALVFPFLPKTEAQRTNSNPLGGNITAQDAGTCSTIGTFLWQTLPTNASTTTVNLSGVFSATVTIRESNNGGGSWSTVTTLTTTGTSTFITNGFTDICADVTTYTSGNVAITLSTGIGVGVPALPSGVAGTNGSTPLVISANNTDGLIINPSATGQVKNLLKVGDGGGSTIFNVVGSGGTFAISLGGAFQAAATLNGDLVAGGTFSLTGTGACSTFSATAGGSWAGSATCSGTTGAATITITPGPTAPHFYSCFGSDITIAHTLVGSQSGFSNTACTINLTSVTSTDNVQITAFAY